MAAFKIGYFIFLSVVRMSQSLGTLCSYAFMTSIPLLTKNFATDLVNLASQFYFVLPLMKVSLKKVYLSLNLWDWRQLPNVSLHSRGPWEKMLFSWTWRIWYDTQNQNTLGLWKRVHIVIPNQNHYGPETGDGTVGEVTIRPKFSTEYLKKQ